MTRVAEGRLVGVAASAAVLRIHSGLTVFVTRQTSECLIIVRYVVAVLAAIPLASVRARVYREVRSVVVESRSVPRIDAVAVQAGRGEARTLVFVVVILLVTGNTIVVIGRLED